MYTGNYFSNYFSDLIFKSADIPSLYNGDNQIPNVYQLVKNQNNGSN